MDNKESKIRRLATNVWKTIDVRTNLGELLKGVWERNEIHGIEFHGTVRGVLANPDRILESETNEKELTALREFSKLSDKTRKRLTAILEGKVYKSHGPTATYVFILDENEAKALKGTINLRKSVGSDFFAELVNLIENEEEEYENV